MNPRAKLLDARMEQEAFHYDTIESPEMDVQLLYSLKLMAHHVQRLHPTDAPRYAGAAVL